MYVCIFKQVTVNSKQEKDFVNLVQIAHSLTYTNSLNFDSFIQNNLTTQKFYNNYQQWVWLRQAKKYLNSQL